MLVRSLKRKWPVDDDRWYDSAGWLDNPGMGWLSQAGVEITERAAMNIAAVHACVKVLSQTVAQVPLILYRRDGESRQRATDHPYYALLHDRPNPYMTSYHFRQTMTSHVARWGNAYAYIDRDKRTGYAVGLYPLRPDKMNIGYVDNGLVYRYDHNGTYVDYPHNAILHIKGLAFNGVQGESPISQLGETLGLSVAARDYGSRFFKNDARPGGVLQHPASMSDEAWERFRKSWRESYGGGNQHSIAILEEGMQFEQVGIPARDAQLLELREFERREIASVFRIPPHKLADLDRATHSNIEHQQIEFRIDTMLPWYVNWEQELNMNLLEEDYPGFYAEFLLDAIERGDTKSRYEAYSQLWDRGILSADEIRKLENMDPQPDGVGQIYYVPVNMWPAGKPLESEDEEPRSLANRVQTRGVQDKARLAQNFRPIFEDTLKRVFRREKADVMRQAEKMLERAVSDEFETWLKDFYREHPDWVDKQFTPVFESFMGTVAAHVAEEVGEEIAGLEPFLREYVEAFAKRESSMSLSKLLDAYKAAEESPVEALRLEFGGWETSRVAADAEWEVNRAMGALTRESYRLGGVTKIKWRTVGKNCPFCNNLDGKVVDISEPFANKGDKIGAVDKDGNPIIDEEYGYQKHYSFPRKTLHPPAHSGCDCVLTPEAF